MEKTPLLGAAVKALVVPLPTLTASGLGDMMASSAQRLESVLAELDTKGQSIGIGGGF